MSNTEQLPSQFSGQYSYFYKHLNFIVKGLTSDFLNSLLNLTESCVQMPAVRLVSAASSESLELYPAPQTTDSHPSHLLSPSPTDISSYMPAQMVSTAQ